MASVEIKVVVGAFQASRGVKLRLASCGVKALGNKVIVEVERRLLWRDSELGAEAE